MHLMTLAKNLAWHGHILFFNHTSRKGFVLLTLSQVFHTNYFQTTRPMRMVVGSRQTTRTCFGVNEKLCQEDLVRMWYNIQLPESLTGSDQKLDALLYQSDDEVGTGDCDEDRVLLQSDSEGSQSDCDMDGAMLLESDDDNVQEEPEPSKRRKYTARQTTPFSFLGRTVCARAHQQLYGISSRVLQNLRENLPGYTMHEKRLQEPKHSVLKVSLKRNSENMQWPHVVTFFWILYISAAEVLPTRLVMPNWQTEIVEGDPDFSERFTCGFLRDVEKHFELSHPGQIGPATFQGPRRYLEHAKPIDLYMQYTAYADAERIKPASRATFMRVFRRVFSTHLKFRDKAEFGQCEICYRYKQKIKKSATRSERLTWTRSYSNHLFAQWRDRQFYWRMRELSRQFFSQQLAFGISKIHSLELSSSVLTTIMDGMDQSKLRVPKWGYVRLPKSLEVLYRPALHLAATWIHGDRLWLSVSDENVKKNSASQTEQLVRSLSNLLTTTSQLPLHLHCQTDNCFREGKNQFVSAFMMMAVVLKIFRSTSQGYLRKAHSHEDVDQVFGQVARLLQGKAVATADAMVDLLNALTKRQGTSTTSAGHILKSSCSAYRLDEVTCWQPFVSQLGVFLKGMRHVHYIRFCERKDMGADILDNVAEVEEMRGQRDRHPEDIFVVTKQWLADTNIARAICVMPFLAAQQVRTGYALPAGLEERRPISDSMRNNINRYAAKCQRLGTLSKESADYLLQWVGGTLPKHPKPTLYGILTYRYIPALRGEAVRHGAWKTPARKKHVNLSLVPDAELDEGSSSDEGEVVLPQALLNAS